MSKTVIKGSRKIKLVDKTYKKGDSFLHPLTLRIVTNTQQDKITPSEYYYDNITKKIESTKLNIENLDYSQYEIQKYMSLPYLNLNYDTIVHFFYEIGDIDKLNSIVNLKINNNNPPKNIIRIINSWIKFNYNDLKKYNNFIYSLFKKINDKYYKLEYNKDDVIKFIDNWINKKSLEDFEFDIFSDLIKFINK